MENYRILERLGKGAQGSVHLVEHRKNEKHYVLKKVECSDENEANKAYKEVKALKDLTHPYICNYHEFFVTWDKEESTMYLCIVMDHYKHGDLAQHLEQKREAREIIDEATIKKWLGQLIEVMHYIHKHKFIHRDLKPSNIFLTQDLDIRLGDFGVSTIMSDVRTKTRTAVGSMIWMAPEVTDSPYDARSDIWSVGCMVLEMMTCGTCDSAVIVGILVQMKHSDAVLQDTIAKVQNSYSADLISVVTNMLSRNPEQRPTTEELSEIPYVKECLAVSGSVIAQSKKTKGKNAPVWGQIPVNQGLEPIIDYLGQNLGNEECVRKTLAQGEKEARVEGVKLDTLGKQTIVRAMHDFLMETDIQQNGCLLLKSLAMTASLGDYLFSTDVISTIAKILKEHSESIEVRKAAISLLTALSADDSAVDLMGDHGCIQEILLTLQTFPSDADLCTVCCNALWNITITEDNARILSQQEGMKDIVSTLESHFEIPALAEAACAALFSVSVEEENESSLRPQGVIELLLKVIDRHSNQPKVVQNACMTLASMAGSDEESAFRILSFKAEESERSSSGSQKSGLQIIIDSYSTHRDNADVIDSVTSLFSELTEYYEILEEMKFLKVGETVLKEVQKRYKDNQGIIANCTTALEKMGIK